MKSLFLDTNVLIDFLANRQPHSISATFLMDLAAKGDLKIYVTSLSYSNIYYIIRKLVTHKKLISILKDLNSITRIISITDKTIESALQSDFKDFEDAIQYFAALSNSSIEAIVTRDPKGFSKSQIPVITPDEAVSFYLNQ